MKLMRKILPINSIEKIFFPDLELKKFNLSIKKLSKKFKILHLTDLHLCAKDYKRYEHFFNGLEKENFDFIFITGDLIEDNDAIDICIDLLKKLNSSYGKYIVLGNHDYYEFNFIDSIIRIFYHYEKTKNKNDYKKLTKILEANDFIVLKNNYKIIQAGNYYLKIVGLDYCYSNEDIERLFKEKKDFNIILAHSPDIYKKAIEYSYDILFAGHSHGGQVWIPFFGPVIKKTILHKKFINGINKIKNTFLSISPGLGESKYFRFRFFTKRMAFLLKINYNS